MVISDRYRYLYFVIPKCGSATVRHALEPFTDVGYPVTAFEEHVTIRKFLSKYDEAGRFDRCFKFTFVRNPYDRLYSAFRQDMIASTRWEPWIEVKQPIFKKVGDDFNTYMQDYVAGADLHNAWDWICFCPMVDFSHLNGTLVLDWIGRTENLDQDIRQLAGLLGVEFGEIEKLNVRGQITENDTQQPGYLKHYTRETVRLVNEVYAEDFAAFGYQMRNPDDFPLTLPS